jgi:hypothetical protein
MKGRTKTGFSTISHERLQCARRDSADQKKEEKEYYTNMSGATEEKTNNPLKTVSILARK